MVSPHDLSTHALQQTQIQALIHMGMFSSKCGSVYFPGTCVQLDCVIIRPARLCPPAWFRSGRNTKRMYAKEYINFKVAPQDIIIIPHFWVCARYLCSDEVFMWGHDLLAPTVSGYMLWWWYQLPVLSVESTSVVTLLHITRSHMTSDPSPPHSYPQVKCKWIGKPW